MLLCTKWLFISCLYVLFSRTHFPPNAAPPADEWRSVRSFFMTIMAAWDMKNGFPVLFLSAPLVKTSQLHSYSAIKDTNERKRRKNCRVFATLQLLLRKKTESACFVFCFFNTQTSLKRFRMELLNMGSCQSPRVQDYGPLVSVKSISQCIHRSFLTLSH